MADENTHRGALVLRSGSFDGVKVFSATMFAERQALGEAVTAWIAADPNRELVEIVVTQSSDSQFHCIAITVFFRLKRAPAARRTATAAATK